MEFTEPFEAAVVAVAQSAELTTPRRTSLPSMLPPAWRSDARVDAESGERGIAPHLGGHRDGQEAHEEHGHRR